MSFFYSLLIIFASVNILLVSPKAVNMAEKLVETQSIPTNNIVEGGSKVKGTSAIIPRLKENFTSVPYVSATALVVKDTSSKTLLYVKDPDKRVPIASTTKIMTALVASEYFKPADVLTVKTTSLVGGSSMGLKLGEEMTFRSLLYGMLLNSGNDAAFTIADNYPGGKDNFILAMNEKAKSLGLINTHFENPAGFDGGTHYSSANDLAVIAEAAITNSQFSRIVSTKDTVVFSIDKQSEHSLKNLNKLLSLPGFLGIKTGTTPIAKENLVALVERNGRKILTVVLGSDDRFTETEKIIDWSYSNFIWE
ncbi:MAG: serine hydrolase [Candidatus Daviesbacteria bacterium]|nr:serine hydrolase [Candidatus Daviesbacteria bacterium]